MLSFSGATCCGVAGQGFVLSIVLIFLPACRLEKEPQTPRHPTQVSLARQVVTPTESMDVDELWARAQRRFQAERYSAAAADFDRVYEVSPAGPRSPQALFLAGEAHDLAANYPEALTRYQTLLRRFATQALARTALMRCIRLLAHLERWREVGQYADVALDHHEDLRPFEAIVVFGGKALALVDEGDAERASYYAGKGLTVAEAASLDAAGRIPRDLAQLYYALGEVRRLRAERITFSPTPPDFSVVLEQRCRLLLDAQTSYSDTMRAYDAHWSAMAGYRVGELYQNLHRDLMLVTPPETADSPERAQLFEGAMRLRYAILLTKASSMMEHTVAMARRAHQESAWVARAEAALRQLALAREREENALEALPYTRAQLQAALDGLESKYQK